ncbi:MAG: hypothetical protein JWO95_3029 [Verrucomicrobiales bacterium]|nr:hypothetical protein [Verrucomicrobiales bacterium]
MFNLEQAVAQWRERLLRAGIERESSLDELECHLRDDIDRQIINGLNLEQSFQVAIGQIGSATSLKSEFTKVQTSKEDPMNHNRIYTATLWVFAVYNCIIIAAGLYYWAVLGQTNEPMGRYPAWALQWMFALTCVYTVLIFATLVARRKDHTLGERFSRVLNWLMLAALPGGTVIGLYGLFFVDKRKALSA